jgi:hypothetical protein
MVYLQQYLNFIATAADNIVVVSVHGQCSSISTIPQIVPLNATPGINVHTIAHSLNAQA